MTTDLLLSCETKPSHISDLNVMLYNLMQKMLWHIIVFFLESLGLGWGEEMRTSSLRAAWPRI
jgi:hypothetical protein